MAISGFSNRPSFNLLHHFSSAIDVDTKPKPVNGDDAIIISVDAAVDASILDSQAEESAGFNAPATWRMSLQGLLGIWFGKSPVLENIVGRDFLTRRSGLNGRQRLASINHFIDYRYYSSDLGSSTFKSQEMNGINRPMNAGLSVITRLTEEFEQGRQLFGDDATFLVEVKSGLTKASLNPDKEFRRLKQMFEAWKKDYGVRLRETKAILNKLGNEESAAGSNDKRMKWWGRMNSTRI